MDWLAHVCALTLTAFVIIVSFFDLRQRRIPNALVFPAMLIGLCLHSLWHGWAGLLFAAKGLGAGFLLLFVPYLLGRMSGIKTMGAGDVKFLAAIGVLLGATDVFRALLAGLLCYPLLAAVPVIREGKLRVTWLRFRRVLLNFFGFFVPSFKLYAMRLESQDDKNIASATTPFGVALAAGTLIALYTNFLRA